MTKIINYTHPAKRCDKPLTSCKGCHNQWICQRQRELIEMYGCEANNEATDTVNKIDVKGGKV
jgi:hypothetical protein